MNPQNISKQEFYILSLLHHTEKVSELESKLKLLIYILDREQGENKINSYEKGDIGPEPIDLQSNIESLLDKNLLFSKTKYTFGGYKREYYTITESGSTLVENSAVNYYDVKKIHQLSKNIVDEYGDIPISNFIEIVKKENPRYFYEKSI